MYRLLALSGLLFLGACASVDVAPGPVASAAPFMPSGMQVDAPQGYVDMCGRDAALCDDRSAVQASQVEAPQGEARLTPASWNGAPEAAMPEAAPDMAADQQMALLNRVNLYVNGNVAQRTDMQTMGVEEYWRRSGVGMGATGDCKDIAIEKRLQLIQHGYPARNLFYAIAFRSDIGLHAVLVARTAMGDVVLDNRTPYIVSWTQAPYVWVKRQSRSDPSVWALVNGPSAPEGQMRVASLDMNAADSFASAQAR